MTKWLQMSEQEIEHNAGAKKARQLEYYNTFYGTPEGRNAMADLRRRVYNPGNMEPVAVLARISLFEEIRELCGIVDNLAVIEAEAASNKIES